MSNIIRLKVTDKDGNIVYIPDATGWALITQETKESLAISLSTLSVGLGTITLEGYIGSVGFIRGLLVTCKSKSDTILTTTLIGSVGFNLTGAGWSTILQYPLYIYTDIANMNIAFTWDTVAL